VSNVVAYGVEKECFLQRIGKGQTRPIERENRVSTMSDYWVMADVLLDKISNLPDSRIGDDRGQ
jgi:hypothetical protein